MGKHYDALRKKCPCQYCQAETALNNWSNRHEKCVTPSPMYAYEQAAEERAEPVELIACAAIQGEHGVTFAGKRHHNLFPQIKAAGLGGLWRVSATMGFMTTHGRFVGREEARKIHEATVGHSADPGGYRGDGLFSEDLYWMDQHDDRFEHLLTAIRLANDHAAESMLRAFIENECRSHVAWGGTTKDGGMSSPVSRDTKSLDRDVNSGEVNPVGRARIPRVCARCGSGFETTTAFQRHHCPIRKKREGAGKGSRYLELYREGMSSREIAIECGVSRHAVSASLILSGVVPSADRKAKTAKNQQQKIKESAKYWRDEFRRRMKESGYACCSICKEYDLIEMAALDGKPMTPHSPRKSYYVHRACNSDSTRKSYAKRVGKPFIPRGVNCACGKPSNHMGTCPNRPRSAQSQTRRRPRLNLFQDLLSHGKTVHEIAETMKISVGSVYNYKWMMNRESGK
jgi:DNA-binding CsgD family transcriptional regulator